MAISLPMTGGIAARLRAVARPLHAASLARLHTTFAFAARHWSAVAVIAFTVAVHVPSLGYYFDGDDFVVLGSVEYLGAQRYVVDSWLMRDIVASWRPLTAMMYAAEWQLFGLDPLGWRLVNLSVHVASVAMLYALVLRTTQRRAAGALAALIFGVSGAHFDTVNYVTALPHLLATFFVLASLVAMIAYASPVPAAGIRAPGGDAVKRALHPPAARGHTRYYVLSFALFLLAFLSNEGGFVYAPLIVAAYALFGGAWRRPVALAAHAAPFALVAILWLVFYDACGCEQLKIEEYGWGPHVARNFGVYLSWLSFPTGEVPLAPDELRWAIAAATTLLLGVAALRGPHVARLCAAGAVVALLPFVPVEIWTASRYTYAAVAFFAPVAAVVAVATFERGRRLPSIRVPATVAALALVVTVGGLYAWQTQAQHERSGAAGERWRLLTSELQAAYDDVPDGTTIYIVDGPWQNPMEQYAWVPSVARALYGDAAAFDLPRSAYEADPPRTRNALFLEWRDGRLHPWQPSEVSVSSLGRASGD